MRWGEQIPRPPFGRINGQGFGAAASLIVGLGQVDDLISLPKRRPEVMTSGKIWHEAGFFQRGPHRMLMGLGAPFGQSEHRAVDRQE